MKKWHKIVLAVLVLLVAACVGIFFWLSYFYEPEMPVNFGPMFWGGPTRKLTPAELQDREAQRQFLEAMKKALEEGAKKMDEEMGKHPFHLDMREKEK